MLSSITVVHEDWYLCGQPLAFIKYIANFGQGLQIAYERLDPGIQRDA
jgi:hemolysin-activating ACP:hemolysin acyltransferase